MSHTARLQRLSLAAGTFTLSNGLQVVVHTDRTAPVVAVSLTYRVGSQHESRGLSGLAHLLEHLMSQGTRNLAPREISQLIASSGGVANAYTMRSNTTYHSVVPATALKTVLWAEAERMSALEIDERALALEQQVVLEEMRWRDIHVPYARSLDTGMAEAVFSKWENRHPTIGEADDIRQARLDDVHAFYQAHYAPNNAVLALAGDVDASGAGALCERFFGPLQPRAIARRADLFEPPLSGDVRAILEDPFAAVPLLMVGWRAPERGTRDYWALMLLAEILAGREDSPLQQALVKKARIALSSNSAFPWWTGPFNPGGPDLFGLRVRLKAVTSCDTTLEIVDGVLAATAAAASLLASAKTRLELAWTTEIEPLRERAKTLSSYAALVGDPAGLADDLACLMSVSVDDMQRTASEWLTGKCRAVVEVRPSPPPARRIDVPAAAIPAPRPRTSSGRRPELDVQAPLALAPIERFALSNGLRVAFVRDDRLPLLNARLMIPGGRLAERPGEEGCSAAAAELLLAGAAGRDANAVAGEFSRIGWTVSVEARLEHLTIGAAGLSRNRGEFFHLLGTSLAQASYPETEIAVWQENKIASMNVQRNDPDFMASQRIRTELFVGHPYGHAALTDGQIAAVTRAQVDRWRRRAITPGGAVLVVTGDAESADLRETLERAFAEWIGHPDAVDVPYLPEPRPARVVIVDRPASQQVTLAVAEAIPLAPNDPDALAFGVANQILGASSTSRLFVTLRVDKGYTYGAYSKTLQMDRGLLWTAATQVRSDVAAEALADINTEITRLREQPVPEEALNAVKRCLAGRFLITSSSSDSRTDSIAAYERQRQSPEYEFSTYLDRLAALTSADIQRVARRYLDPATMVTVAVGDAATLCSVLPA